jgi:hypothetical protein
MKKPLEDEIKDKDAKIDELTKDYDNILTAVIDAFDCYVPDDDAYTEAGCLVLGIENASLHLNDLIEKSDNLYAFVCDYVDGNWDCAAEHERDERAWKLKQLYAEDTAGDNEIDTEQSASTFNPEEWEITIAPGSSCELAELDDNQISRSYPGRTDCHLHATRVGFPDIGDVDAQFGRYPNMKNVPWHLVKGYPDVTEVSE